MGLVKCPDCGKEISSMATHCINCGRPMKIIEASDITDKEKTTGQEKDKEKESPLKSKTMKGIWALPIGIIIFCLTFIKPETIPQILLLLAISVALLFILYYIVRQIGKEEAKKTFGKTLLITLTIVFVITAIIFFF